MYVLPIIFLLVGLTYLIGCQMYVEGDSYDNKYAIGLILSESIVVFIVVVSFIFLMYWSYINGI